MSYFEQNVFAGLWVIALVLWSILMQLSRIVSLMNDRCLNKEVQEHQTKNTRDDALVKAR